MIPIIVTKRPDTTEAEFSQGGDVLSRTNTAGMAYATVRGLLECGFAVAIEGGEPITLTSTLSAPDTANRLVRNLF